MRLKLLSLLPLSPVAREKETKQFDTRWLRWRSTNEAIYHLDAALPEDLAFELKDSLKCSTDLNMHAGNLIDIIALA